MGITVNKKAEKQKAVEAEAQASAQAVAEMISPELVEEIAALEAQHKQANDHAKAIKKELDERMAMVKQVIKDCELESEQTVSVTGTEHSLEIGVERMNVEISDKEAMMAALEEVDEGLTFTLMKVNLTDLKEYLSQKVIDTFTEKKASGIRAIKTKSL